MTSVRDVSASLRSHGGNCLLEIEASRLGVLEFSIKNKGSKDEHCSIHLESQLSGSLGRKIMTEGSLHLIARSFGGKKTPETFHLGFLLRPNLHGGLCSQRPTKV